MPAGIAAAFQNFENSMMVGIRLLDCQRSSSSAARMSAGSAVLDNAIVHNQSAHTAAEQIDSDIGAEIDFESYSGPGTSAVAKIDSRRILLGSNPEVFNLQLPD